MGFLGEKKGDNGDEEKAQLLSLGVPLFFNLEGLQLCLSVRQKTQEYHPELGVVSGERRRAAGSTEKAMDGTDRGTMEAPPPRPAEGSPPASIQAPAPASVEMRAPTLFEALASASITVLTLAPDNPPALVNTPG